MSIYAYRWTVSKKTGEFVALLLESDSERRRKKERESE